MKNLILFVVSFFSVATFADCVSTREFLRKPLALGEIYFTQEVVELANNYSKCTSEWVAEKDYSFMEHDTLIAERLNNLYLKAPKKHESIMIAFYGFAEGNPSRQLISFIGGLIRAGNISLSVNLLNAMYKGGLRMEYFIYNLEGEIDYCDLFVADLEGGIQRIVKEAVGREPVNC